MAKKKKTKSEKIIAPPIDIEAQYSEILGHLKEENRLRTLPTSIQSDTKIDLLSNDYLGLAKESGKYYPEFLSRFQDAASSFSSSASRLLSGVNKYHNLLERYLEDLYGRPALVFNSGYHANIGIIQALAIPGTLFLSDRLIHASAIDGIRLSGADFKRFPHNDIKKLKSIIKQNYDDYQRIIILTESIFSMDGDLVPLKNIVDLKNRYPKLMIYLDEAHSFGVLGVRGLGLAEELGLIDNIDIIMGTLGKAAASAGAFAIVSPVMKDYLINTSRSFIFSTALPPVQAAWSIFMIEKLVELNARRIHLHKLSHSLIRQLFARLNIETCSKSHIIPIILGDAGEALNMASFLSSNGFSALAIRKPTVPSGSERIRLSLNALLDEKDISRLVDVIGKYQ